MRILSVWLSLHSMFMQFNGCLIIILLHVFVFKHLFFSFRLTIPIIFHTFALD